MHDSLLAQKPETSDPRPEPLDFNEHYLLLWHKKIQDIFHEVLLDPLHDVHLRVITCSAQERFSRNLPKSAPVTETGRSTSAWKTDCFAGRRALRHIHGLAPEADLLSWLCHELDLLVRVHLHSFVLERALPRIALPCDSARSSATF